MEKYEDSAKKADRLWSEYISLYEEYKGTIEILKKDQAESERIFAVYVECLKNIISELESQNSDLEKIERLKASEVKLKEEWNAARGDVKGTLAICDMYDNKTEALESQLREIGELD